MAVKTRAQLKAENAADFPDNTTRRITPASLRGQMDDVVDSVLFPEDGISTLETAEPDTFSNVAIGYAPAVPSNRLLVVHNDLDAPSSINVAGAFQQIIGDTARTIQPTCLRGYQRLDPGVDVASSFAISGELDSYTDDGGGLGLSATSGVAQKFGDAPVFAMHAVAIDNVDAVADPTQVTSIIGAEFGTRACGPDHPTSNLGYGSRRTVQIVPRSNPEVNATAGETGIGLDVRTSATSGYYRYAVVIREIASNPNPIGTALEIDTSGTNGIVIKGGQTVPINVTGTGYFVNGTKVLGAQGAAVANATDAASVITQLNALLARLRAHGIIAT